MQLRADLPAMAAAIGLPLLLSVGVVVGLTRPETLAPRPPSPAARKLEQVLADDDPTLVIVGPSAVGFDLDPELLVDRLGDERVTLISVAGSAAPGWYVVLRDRVFGAGHRPAGVVIAGHPATLLGVRPISREAWDRVDALSDGIDLSLSARVQGRERGSAPWLRAEARRAALRRGAMDGLRQLTLSLLPGASLPLDLGADVAIAGGAATPSFDYARDASVGPGETLPPPEQGFLPDLVALVQAQGSWLAIAELPVRSDVRRVLAPAGERERVRVYAEAHGVDYLDLSGLPLDDAAWRDGGVHLDAAAARQLTEALAEALRTRSR